jgi:hypothetical protein
MAKGLHVKNLIASQTGFAVGAAGSETTVIDANGAISVPSGQDQTIGGDLVVSGGDIDAGASGAAGTVDIFPSTALKGKLTLSCADQTGNTTFTLEPAAHGQATKLVINDIGQATAYAVQASTPVTAAQANVLAANKAVVVDASKDVASFNDVTLSKLITDNNAGSPGTGVTAVEYGDGYNHTTVLTVAGTLPAITGDTAQGLGLLMYTFPAGEIIVDGSSYSLAITQSEGNINADTPEVGLGTVIATGAIVALDTPATFENISTGVAADDCNGTAEVKTAIPTAGVPFVIATGDAHTVYFNLADAFDAAAGGDAAATLGGTLVLNWRSFV